MSEETSTDIRSRRHKGRRALRMIAVAIAAVALPLAGCGSSGGGSSSNSSSTPATSQAAPSSSGSSAGALSLEANKEGELKYDTQSLSAKAGSVSIDFTNTSSLSHNVTVESSSGQILGSTPTFQGGSKTLSLSLKPGTYKFFCTVPGHRQAGMEGTLTVQ